MAPLTLSALLALPLEARLAEAARQTPRLAALDQKHHVLINTCNAPGNPDGILAGITYLAKDNIATKDIITTGGSQILAHYRPPFDATVISRLANAGATLIGKTTLDELAMGGTGTTCFTGITTNPYDHTRRAGGSSAGSAAAVAAGVTSFALGTDTGDSIRKPASYTGVVGCKPSYGLISRHGVFPFACSLDHVGVFTRSTRDVALLFDVLGGKDPLDPTTYEITPQFAANLNSNVNNKRVAVIKEINDSVSEPKVHELFTNVVNHLKAGGAEVEVVSIDAQLLRAILPTYMIISCAEASSNNANLTGLAFGEKVDGETPSAVMLNTRTAGFGKMIKRRFLIGSYILEAEHQEKYFIKAQRVRQKIIDAFNAIFSSFDVIIAPAAPGPAGPIITADERMSDEYLIADNYMAFANFMGAPSITIPFGWLGHLPVGLNITAAFKQDQVMLDVAYYLENCLGLVNQCKEDL